MHPYLHEQVAAARIKDFRRDADLWRSARQEVPERAHPARRWWSTALLRRRAKVVVPVIAPAPVTASREPGLLS